MLNSRDIDKLRPDVAANCKTFLTMCDREGSFFPFRSGWPRLRHLQKRKRRGVFRPCVL